MFFGYARKDISEIIKPASDAQAQRFKDRLKDPSPAVWLFTGDSITHGCRHTKGLRSYPEYIEWHVKNSEGRKNDVFINTAVSGSTTRHALEYNIGEIKRFKPDFVFAMYGTNDCNPKKNISLSEFSYNLEKYVQSVLTGGAQIVMQTPQPCNRDKLLKPYLTFIRELSAKYGVVLIDHHETWKRCGAKYGYMSDRIHPNACGHLLYAKTIVRKLMPAQCPLTELLPQALPDKDRSDCVLTSFLLNNRAYSDLVRSNASFLTLCAIKDDFPLTRRNETMRLQEDLRFAMFNRKETSMMRFFVSVLPEDLPHYIKDFQPEAILTEDSENGYSLRLLNDMR